MEGLRVHMDLKKKPKNYIARYQSKEIKMSTDINRFLNLINSIEMKINHYTVFGIIYSISMNSIKIIFK